MSKANRMRVVFLTLIAMIAMEGRTFSATSAPYANAMMFYGIVRDVHGTPLNGIQITLTNFSKGYAFTVMSGAATQDPGNPLQPRGPQGGYFGYWKDDNNSPVAMAGDILFIWVTDPAGRFIRPINASPSGITLGTGDVVSGLKRLDLIIN